MLTGSGDHSSATCRKEIANRSNAPWNSTVESFAVPGDSGGTVSTVETSEVAKFVGGLYADLNFEWLANERTGLFAGVSAQQFGSYDQSVGGRTARIDLGSTVGLRYGVTIRY